METKTLVNAPGLAEHRERVARSIKVRPTVDAALPAPDPLVTSVISTGNPGQ
jgi:hypothetical protein